MRDWDEWYIEAGPDGGVSLYCVEPDCAWTYTHPFLAVQVRELRLMAATHAQEAHG